MSLGHDELRDVIRLIRHARALLADGRPRLALGLYGRAARLLHFSRGASQPSPNGRLVTTVIRALDQVGCDLQVAMIPPLPADPLAVVHDIAEGLRVLRDRDGVPLTEDQINERARNIGAGLLANYDIRARRSPSHSSSTGPSARGDSGFASDVQEETTGSRVATYEHRK